MRGEGGLERLRWDRSWRRLRSERYSCSGSGGRATAGAPTHSNRMRLVSDASFRFVPAQPRCRACAGLLNEKPRNPASPRNCGRMLMLSTGCAMLLEGIRPSDSDGLPPITPFPQREPKEAPLPPVRGFFIFTSPLRPIILPLKCHLGRVLIEMVAPALPNWPGRADVD